MSKNKFDDLPEKISLVDYPYIRYMIKTMRTDKKRTAEALSVEIGKSKSWLAQIENGRLNSIMKSDLLLIITKLATPLYGSIEEEIIFYMQLYETDYQNKLQDELDKANEELPLTEDTIIKRDIVKVIFDIKNIIFNNYNNLTIDEKKKILNSLDVLNKNLDSNINLTCLLLALPIYAINSTYDNNLDNEKNFIKEINAAFTAYLSSSLNS